jgi:limonene-1,2-epoxide hydrolase
MSPDPVVDRVLRLFDQWGESYEAMAQSLFDHFAPGCVWENPNLPTTVGPRQAVDLVVAPARAQMGLERIEVITDRITHADGLVWTERVDHLLRADESVLLSALLVGVMEVEPDGRITAWREYSKHLAPDHPRARR